MKNGDNENDGSSFDDAVKTEDRAISIIQDRIADISCYGKGVISVKFKPID